VPRYIHYADFMKMTYGQSVRRYHPYDHPSGHLHESYAMVVHALDQWHDTIVEPRPDARDTKPNVVFDGSIISSERVCGDPTSDYQQEMIQDFEDGVAVEMESYGLGVAVFSARHAVTYNPRFLVVRGISDTAQVATSDGEVAIPVPNEKERSEWAAYASTAASSFATAIVERFLTSPDPRPQLRGTSRSRRRLPW
jgi:hypothetical protein